ncbi:hypothetical protein ACFE04_018771 [Oxalis oulophora]
MGCNVSRIETDGEGRVRTDYRRRIDDFLKHSNSRNQRLSKKNLLKDRDESRSPPTSEGSVDSVKTNNEEEKSKKHIVEKDEKVVALIALEEVLMIESEDEEDDNESRTSNFSGALICPGSPSFRVYCIDSSCDEKEDDGDHQDKAEGSVNKILETGDIEVSQARTCPDEDSYCRKIPKAKGGRKFKRVLLKPKGKNFMLVKSCYIPACVGVHDHNPRLIAAKANS